MGKYDSAGSQYEREAAAHAAGRNAWYREQLALRENGAPVGSAPRGSGVTVAEARRRMAAAGIVLDAMDLKSWRDLPPGPGVRPVRHGANDWRMIVRHGDTTSEVRADTEAACLAFAKKWLADAKTRSTPRTAEIRLLGAATGAPTVEGYAVVWDAISQVLYEPDVGKFRERVTRGAFRRSIERGDDVLLLTEHRDLPLGTTRAGTLRLEEDPHGLRFSSVLDGDDPDVQRLIPKLKRGDLSKCSFCFVTVRESWDTRTRPPTRTLEEAELRDVSIVARPAYGGTSVSVKG